MECFGGLSFAPSTAILRRPLRFARKTTRNGWLRAELSDQCDHPLLHSAIEAASLRFQETLRPEPLFVDTYAGCFVPPNTPIDTNNQSNHYCIATKFIDDKLLETVNQIDGVKQVVLLTDGMDTRPYRLKWPPSTIVYDISPERVFNASAEKLKAAGAKVPKGCLSLHVPMESSNMEQIMRSKGFDGNRPSIWVIQGLPLLTLASLEDILLFVGSLAMNKCLFFGEFHVCLPETEIGVKSDLKKWMEKLFMRKGFRVETISYDDIAKNLGKELALEDYHNILFTAEQLRFSDDQMDIWRREFMRIEDEGNEDGFEEL